MNKRLLTYLLTYLITYLLNYSLTYLLVMRHGQQWFLTHGLTALERERNNPPKLHWSMIAFAFYIQMLYNQP